ncbi:hypothetical protein MLD38_034415 [Melastoma candidum]|uniref:Uncharacterized protein n=1 Tax=Melastoma candidum TaxID=119954 RepID=A0ACB9MAI0_9MYRT|nr:hypothetical protein MLD38_034415 [Melastoma candidum]
MMQTRRTSLSSPPPPPPLLLLLAFFLFSETAYSQSFVGVNYGQVADNLPPPAATAKLLQSTSIQKVRMYGADQGIIQALANTGIGIVIGTTNGDIPALANDPGFARSWVGANVVPFYPASKIVLVTVGNEVMTSGDGNLMGLLLPAMQNVQDALDGASLGGKVKVSTVHSMAVLQTSEPPSSGHFDPSLVDLLKGQVGFNDRTGSPFMINPYPYFAYRSDPRADTLAFCLFQPNAGRFDPNTKINYMNMFDAQVDAVRSALNSIGFNNVEIVVAETGWPYKGDDNEVGPSIENAKAYNGNLVTHLRSTVGTPLMPGKSVDTYLFALYDEDLKPGPSSERSFGLFKPDLSMNYDIGLTKISEGSPPVNPPVAPPMKPPVSPPKMPPAAQPPNPGNGTLSVPDAGIPNTQPAPGRSCIGNDCNLSKSAGISYNDLIELSVLIREAILLVLVACCLRNCFW